MTAGYQVSKGEIPSPTGPGVIQVWSAYSPDGQRVMCGGSMFFNAQWEAERACQEHMQGRVGLCA